MDVHLIERRLLKLGLTADKIDELIKDEREAANEYSKFAEELIRLSREVTDINVATDLRKMSRNISSLSRDELTHVKLLQEIQDAVPSDGDDTRCVRS